jgi:alpha-glucoside transport system substrate-binding protein
MIRSGDRTRLAMISFIKRNLLTSALKIGNQIGNPSLNRSRFPNAIQGLTTAVCLLTLSACSQPSFDAGAQDAAKTVTILSPLTEEDQKKFAESLKPFETESGIDVQYQTTPDNFNELLKERIAKDDLPDLVVLPQPGLMEDFLADDLLVPLEEVLDIQELRKAYSDAWLDLGSVDDVPYALWYRVSVKSLVWYQPTVFELNSYEIPRTWAELIELSNKIVAKGGTPWCIGLENGAASGWPATDWIEDILLRTAGPEAYNQWITHQLPFNSPQVMNAFNEFGKILRSPKYVYGGAPKAATTPYSDAALGIFNNDCVLHRQASFAASFFPEDKAPRVDYDVFRLPGIDKKFGTPLLVGGDAIVMFNHTPESQALMKYLITPTPHKIWAGLGGFLSPHQQVPLDAYPDLVTQNIAQILADAEVIRFDGSDLMPGEVGTGSFWKGMLDFAKGKSAAEVTKEIDKSWP